MAKKNEFPLPVQRGSVTVLIYRTPSGGYDRYTVGWYEGRTRKRKTFHDLGEAKQHAETTANKLSRGEAEALKLTSADRHIYVRAVQALKPTGIPLDVAALQFAEVLELIGNHSPVEVARDFARRHPRTLPRRTAPELVEEFLQFKQTKGKSKLYLDDLRYRCGKFGAQFPRQIVTITARDIQDFLDGLKLSGRSTNNFLRSIHTLFEFAKRRGYLPKDHDELSAVEGPEEGREKIEIFTPTEIRRLLAAAPETFVPALALGAFAGLRSAEIERIDWQEIHLDRRFIDLDAEKTKTDFTRLIPITDNLAAWLAPYAKPAGKVWPHSHAYFYEAQRETAKRTKTKDLPAVEWKHNALRHSFISYRVAATSNMNQVAIEAGNSVAMIKRNYNKPQLEAAAKEWFAVVPPGDQNIVPLALPQGA